MSSQHSFDLEDWLDSVEGETVHVTMAEGLGGKANALTTPNTAMVENMTLCPKCEDMRLLVEDGHVIGCCPACGHRIQSMLVLGTRSKEEWDAMDDEVKPDV